MKYECLSKLYQRKRTQCQISFKEHIYSYKNHISQVVIVCDAHLSAQNICFYGSFILNIVNGKRVSVQLTFS